MIRMTQATLKQLHKLRQEAAAVQYDYMTERHVIKANHPQFALLMRCSHQANNLYNYALYLVRHAVFKQNWLSYNQLEKELKAQRNQKSSMVYDYLGNAHLTQQILKLVLQNMMSWSKARKAYEKDPSRFRGRPKLPKYKTKGGLGIVIVDNQTAKLKNGQVVIPTLDYLTIKLQHQHATKIQQVRIVPQHNTFIVEVVYKTNRVIAYKPDNGRYLGIDPGLNNAFTLASNVKGIIPEVINGKALKAFNQYYNKRQARLASAHALAHQPYLSKSMQLLNQQRYHKVMKFSHESSKHVVEYALRHDLNTIVIGYSVDLKHASKMGKRNNQNFINIPHKAIIDKIIYKANLAGIVVLLTSEEFTSQTSFLDQEEPIAANGNKARQAAQLVPAVRRVKRGLFKASTGQKINADVNGALQILKKVVPNAFSNGIVGVGLHPVKVQINF